MLMKEVGSLVLYNNDYNTSTLIDPGKKQKQKIIILFSKSG